MQLCQLQTLTPSVWEGATTDPSSPQPSHCFTQALPEQSLSTHFVFCKYLILSIYFFYHLNAYLSDSFSCTSWAVVTSEPGWWCWKQSWSPQTGSGGGSHRWCWVIMFSRSLSLCLIKMLITLSFSAYWSVTVLESQLESEAESFITQTVNK